MTNPEWALLAGSGTVVGVDAGGTATRAAVIASRPRRARTASTRLRVLMDSPVAEQLERRIELAPPAGPPELGAAVLAVRGRLGMVPS